MKSTKTATKVKRILSQLSGAKRISASDSLKDRLLLDSLALVTLLVEIEDTLGVRLSDEDMDPFSLETAGDVIALAERVGGEQNG